MSRNTVHFGSLFTIYSSSFKNFKDRFSKLGTTTDPKKKAFLFRKAKLTFSSMSSIGCYLSWKREFGSLYRICVYYHDRGSNFLWHVRMQDNEVKFDGAFPSPYDIELINFVGPKNCFYEAKVMFARCMVTIHQHKDMIA